MLFLSIFNVKLPKKSSSLKISGGGDPIFYGAHIAAGPTFWPEIFFLATFQKLTPKFSTFFVVFVGKEITINIVQN